VRSAVENGHAGREPLSEESGLPGLPAGGRHGLLRDGGRQQGASLHARERLELQAAKHPLELKPSDVTQTG